LSRGLRPASAFALELRNFLVRAHRNESNQRHIRSSEIDITLPNMSKGGSVKPT